MNLLGVSSLLNRGKMSLEQDWQFKGSKVAVEGLAALR
jgi:hypothetical protein